MQREKEGGGRRDGARHTYLIYLYPLNNPFFLLDPLINYLITLDLSMYIYMYITTTAPLRGGTGGGVVRGGGGEREARGGAAAVSDGGSRIGGAG